MTFDKLVFGLLDRECVLRPFNAKVKALDYQIDVKYMSPEDFDSLDIVPKDLNLKILHDQKRMLK